GAGLYDLNLDGRLDLVVVNRRAPLEVFENETENTGNWLLLEIEADAPNTRAVGGWIELRYPGGRIEQREITIGGGHASGQAGLHHFGLGGAASVDIRLAGIGGWLTVPANTRGTLSLIGTSPTFRSAN
ncbi:MAG: hypothetical protein GW905_05635, partial [Rhodobacterales bacterium]|nr:hypothetical protein [Rhodobacterales bacterium]